MNEAARAWADRAEAHIATALRESQVPGLPHPAAVVQHAHACVQCALRSILAEASVPFPSTPHLGILLCLCADLDPAWEAFRGTLRTLTARALDAADPALPLPAERADEALRLCRAFLASVPASPLAP